MPVNAEAMAKLKKEYGDKKGESVYYALENEGKMKAKTDPKHDEKTETKEPEKKAEAAKEHKDADSEADKPNFEKMYHEMKNKYDEMESGHRKEANTRTLTESGIKPKHHERLLKMLHDSEDLKTDVDYLRDMFKETGERHERDEMPAAKSTVTPEAKEKEKKEKEIDPSSYGMLG